MSVEAQQCHLFMDKTVDYKLGHSWHHLHGENAEEILNDRMVVELLNQNKGHWFQFQTSKAKPSQETEQVQFHTNQQTRYLTAGNPAGITQRHGLFRTLCEPARCRPSRLAALNACSQHKRNSSVTALCGMYHFN